MKKICTAVLLIIITLPIYAQNENKWTVRTAINAAPGLFYNSTWDPAYNGSAVSVMALYKKNAAVFGAGIEAGYTFTGFNLFFPLRAGLKTAQWNKLSLFLNADILPGIILTRPSPYSLFAAEISAELIHPVTARFNISYSAGLRYTVSPDYSIKVSPLETIDLNISIALR